MKLFIAITIAAITISLTGCTDNNQTNSGSSKDSTNRSNGAATNLNINQANSGTVAGGNTNITSSNNLNAGQTNTDATTNSGITNTDSNSRNNSGKSAGAIQLPRLAKLSVDELDKLLGAPLRQQNIPSIGAMRTYSVNQGKGEPEATITPDNKIKELSLRSNEMRKTSDDLLKAVGIDLKGRKPDWDNGIVKKYENQELGGVKFRRISVSMNPSESVWDRVEVEIAN